ASAHAAVGGRTSKGLAPRQQLLCPPKEFTGGSRTPTPEGSLPPCGWGKYPYPPDYRAAFASSLLLYPLPHRYPLRCAYRQGRQGAYHVPQVCPRGLGPASAPGARHLRRVSSEHPALAPYLLVQASQHLWLVINNGACGGSPGLALPRHPGSRPPWCW